MVQYNGKQFPVDSKLKNSWDEVERDIIKAWKEHLEKEKDKSPLSKWTLENIAGEGKSPGFKVNISDGKHRSEISLLRVYSSIGVYN